MSEYAILRIDMRSGKARYSADEDGQGSKSRQEDLASVIACKQRQITTGGLATAAL